MATSRKPLGAAVKAAARATPTPDPAPLTTITQVLAVASEMYPFIKTGGLADVVGALPIALAALDAAHGTPMVVTTLLPAYPALMQRLTGAVKAKPAIVWDDYFGGTARIHRAMLDGQALLLLDAPHLFNRLGNPYQGTTGKDFEDNPIRFAALALAAAKIGWGELDGYRPDVLHAHDWQAALAPAYLHYLGQGKHRPRTVLTIHNLAFQGQFPASLFPNLGLPPAAFSMDGVEYYGGVGYLKAGIRFADSVTTVSPSYAREIATVQGGMGLDGLLRGRTNAVQGIVNGIDLDVWNPATDKLLAQTYDVNHLAQRQVNKRALEAHFGLAPSDRPLLCMVSRLTWQKGVDVLVQLLDTIIARDVRIVVLGTGDAALEGALLAAKHKHPTHLGVQIGYDEALSHLMQGGSDAILVPSRFEPCGLTQLYGLRYGCVPIVASSGGLADTVIHANDAALTARVATGFQFAQVDPPSFMAAVEQMLTVYANPDQWQSLQRAGMGADVGWARSAARYADLYQSR